MVMCFYSFTATLSHSVHYFSMYNDTFRSQLLSDFSNHCMLLFINPNVSETAPKGGNVVTNMVRCFPILQEIQCISVCIFCTFPLCLPAGYLKSRQAVANFFSCPEAPLEAEVLTPHTLHTLFIHAFSPSSFCIATFTSESQCITT